MLADTAYFIIYPRCFQSFPSTRNHPSGAGPLTHRWYPILPRELTSPEVVTSREAILPLAVSSPSFLLYRLARVFEGVRKAVLGVQPIHMQREIGAFSVTSCVSCLLNSPFRLLLIVDRRMMYGQAQVQACALRLTRDGSLVNGRRVLLIFSVRKENISEIGGSVRDRLDHL